jgi:hypothetical protein
MKKIAQGVSVLALIMAVGISIPVQAADSDKVTGEIIDTYCYSMAGARGEGHRKCALECVKKGIPAGLLEEGTNKAYVLLPKKENSGYPKAVFDNMARKVTITGKMVAKGDSQFLAIESIN